MAPDPLVPVSPERLNALRLRRALSWRQLAFRTDTTHTYLVTIANGRHAGRRARVRRIRRSLRRRLARELRVSEAWLGGERETLPFLESREGTVPLYDFDRPAGVQLAESEFRAQCHHALMRELRETAGSEAGAEKLYREGAWMIFARLMTLVRPGSWRTRLLRRSGPVVEYTEPGPPNWRHEAPATIALCDAWTAILRPWFEGRSGLDLFALNALCANH